jgi:hypothetical protein
MTIEFSDEIYTAYEYVAAGIMILWMPMEPVPKYFILLYYIVCTTNNVI